MASEESILRFVASTTGSIGYVRKQKVDNRVKVATAHYASAAKVNKDSSIAGSIPKLQILFA